MKKKCIIIFFVLIICTISCNRINEDTLYINVMYEDAYVESNEKLQPNNLSVISYDFTNWSKYLKDEFDINVNVSKIGYYSFVENYKTNKGVVIIPVDLYKRIPNKNELFAPLNESVLGDNYNRMPYHLKRFDVVDGKIWSLPVSGNASIIIRNYDKIKMESLNLNAPKTLNEFTNVVYSLNNSFPKETIVKLENINDVLVFRNELSDIFYSNKIYSTSSINYNLENSKYENIIENPNIYNTINYIKNLYNIGIVEFGNNKPITFIGNEYSISDEYLYSQVTSKDMEYALSYNNDVKAVMCLLKNNELENQASKFVEYFYGNDKTSLIGSLGIPNINYVYKEDHITFKESTQTSGLPFLTSFKHNFYYWLKGDNAATKMFNNYFFNGEIPYKVLRESVNFEETVFKDSLYSKSKIELIFLEVLYDGLMQDLSSDDIIIEYNNLSKLYRIDDYIDEMNMKIGK